MASVRSHTRIARSADDVWKVLSDAGAMAAWSPNIDKSPVTGTSRHIEYVGGYSNEEEIVTSDDRLRRFQYRITENAVPIDYLGTIDVIEDGDGSLVIYSAEITPDEYAEITSQNHASSLQGLKEYLEH